MKSAQANARPRIAVTGPDRGGFPAWFFTSVAIRRAGGKPIRLQPKKLREHTSLPPFDGLIIGGGADVDPDSYRELLDPTEAPPVDPPKKRERGLLTSWLLAPLLFLFRRLFSLRASGVDLDRDRCERRLLEDAIERQCPILGICRGAQFINIERGGTLHQDIDGFYTEIGKVASVYAKHLVEVNPNSLLYKILEKERCQVNCLHDQAIHRLGKSLQISARDRAGVVQAIEDPSYPFLVGVQWHPEYLPSIPRQQRLFQALVTKARG